MLENPKPFVESDALARLPPFVNATQFRDAMSRLPAPVHVVTTDGVAGKAGITATAVSSVTADPPIVIFCINKTSSAVERFLQNRCFCVNLLASGGQCLSDVFAGRTAQKLEERFSEGAWRQLETGAPVLDDAVVALDCRLIEVREVSTHLMLLGLVQASATSDSSGVLIYHDRKYASI